MSTDNIPKLRNPDREGRDAGIMAAVTASVSEFIPFFGSICAYYDARSTAEEIASLHNLVINVKRQHDLLRTEFEALDKRVTGIEDESKVRAEITRSIVLASRNPDDVEFIARRFVLSVSVEDGTQEPIASNDELHVMTELMAETSTSERLVFKALLRLLSHRGELRSMEKSLMRPTLQATQWPASWDRDALTHAVGHMVPLAHLAIHHIVKEFMEFNREAKLKAMFEMARSPATGLFKKAVDEHPLRIVEPETILGATGLT